MILLFSVRNRTEQEDSIPPSNCPIPFLLTLSPLSPLFPGGPYRQNRMLKCKMLMLKTKQTEERRLNEIFTAGPRSPSRPGRPSSP